MKTKVIFIIFVFTLCSLFLIQSSYGERPITTVTAGDGLTGGGTSGSVTLSLDTAFTDNRYVNVTGDIITGILTVKQTSDILPAGWFDKNNTSSVTSALAASTNGQAPALVVTTTNGTGYSGYFQGGAGVYISGDLKCHRQFDKGIRFIRTAPSERPFKRACLCLFEGPEHAIFLRGTARLVNGEAVIETPEYFREVAGDKGITVQFTPRYVDTFGLAAVKVTKGRIGVKELKGGQNTYEFDYFITAKRAGFENHDPIQPNKHFTADNQKKEDFEKRYTKTDDMTISVMRNLLVSNGILTKEGKLNMEMVEKLGWKLKEADLALVKE